MSDVLERANIYKDALIKLMKSFEPGTAPFIQSMTLAGKLRKVIDETMSLSANVAANKENAEFRTSFDNALARLEKVMTECEPILGPKSMLMKPAAQAKTSDKSIAVPKELTFVSVDVQGSEDLKKDEDSAKVSKSFASFHALVDRLFKEGGVKKSGWAGDGFIAYFDSAENAILAFLNLRGALPAFNIAQNLLSKNFRIRVGISTGEDYFDEGIEIGKMTSKIIDLSGYLQKKAEITNSAKTLSRVLLSTNTIMKIHKIFQYQRTLKVDKIIIPPDENKKVAGMDAYELLY